MRLIAVGVVVMLMATTFGFTLPALNILLWYGMVMEIWKLYKGEKHFPELVKVIAPTVGGVLTILIINFISILN